MAFTGEQLERYSRHIILKEVGVKGQKKLCAAKVLIIGAGGLGAPAALYLAAAGVGTIGIVDADEVDLSNLQRQVIHTTPDVGKPKVDSAAETMEAINPDVTVKTYQEFVDSTNIMDLIADYDFVIDGVDNFPTKFLINDACVMAKKPFVHAGIIRFRGQLMTYVPGEGPCYRCVFKTMPPKDAVPTCKQAGVIGAMAGVIGCLEALEAIKYICGIGDLLTCGGVGARVDIVFARSARLKNCAMAVIDGQQNQDVHKQSSPLDLPKRGRFFWQVLSGKTFK